MKKIVGLLSILILNNAFACYSSKGFSVCPGDFATAGDYFSRGATVLSVNSRTGQVGLKSISSGSIMSMSVNDIQIGKGCLRKVCVGHFSTAGTQYTRGATVVALNPLTGMVGLKSINSGSISALPVNEIQAEKGCIEGVCVGNTATAGNYFSRGAKVVSINTKTRMIGLKSINAGTMSALPLNQIQGANGCVEGICMGDFVTAGSELSRGGKVISVNYRTRMIGVQSINSGNMMAFPTRELQVSTQCLDFGNRERDLDFYIPKIKISVDITLEKK
jgi:hypothetical protein